MPVSQTEINAVLWRACDTFRGVVDPSDYKNFVLVMLFNFFYVSVTFKPADLAESIQKRGGFVPGVRPGQQTAAMLERVSNHLNLFGGIFLAMIAIIPLVFTMYTKLPASNMLISGSGLIILVGVVMELIRQVNASMLAHDYEKLV